MPDDPRGARAAEVARDIRGRGHQLCLEYAGVSLAYRSDEGASGEWIRTFFEGYLLPSVAEQADAVVCSTADRALFAALQGMAPGEPAVGKRGYVELPSTDSVAVVRREAGKGGQRDEVFLLLFAQERQIVLVTSGDPEVRRRTGPATSQGDPTVPGRGGITHPPTGARRRDRSLMASAPRRGLIQASRT